MGAQPFGISGHGRGRPSRVRRCDRREHAGVTTTAISAVGLTKSFGDALALDGLDLQVRTGEVHGFLGPNGSGKSVTIRILLGLLRHDRGTVELLGGDPWRDAVELHRRIAYVPGDVSLWPNLTGGEVIDLLARMRGGVSGRRRNELVEQLDLDLGKKSRNYSKGNRQKVALVAALASDAELLLLDEPTSGLDPLKEAVFRDCVRDAVAEGRTVLLSSHILAEVEQLCDRVTIIRNGHTVRSGTLADLRQLTRTSIEVTTEHPPEGLDRLPGIHGLVLEGTRAAFEVDGTELEAVMALLGSCGVRALSSRPPTLEELFLRHYGEDLDSPGPDSQP
jgi:ABC-2 type transport system ATP-binding protein